MKKNMKFFVAALTVLLVLCGNLDFAQASEIWTYESQRFFMDVYVDSNTFNTICYSPYYYDRTSRVDLVINRIDKADGSDSSYKRIKTKMIVNTYNSAVKTTYLLETTEFHIPQEYWYYGTVLIMGMGNNPSLDCRINGYVTSIEAP